MTMQSLPQFTGIHRNTLTKPYLTRTYSTGGQEYVEKWDVDMTAKP